MNWKNKKVLVTGADGFIGSHLVQQLLGKGADIRAFVYYNSFNSWGWLDTFAQKDLKEIEIFPGDIRDSNMVLEATKDVDIVFHLAALISIPFSYHSPDSYVDTNIRGTLNVLQAARKSDIEKVIHTSTSEIYGTAQYVPINELHPINPQSPYAATKSAADELALSFYRSFDLPVIVARPFNTFGPRQSARAIIPTILSQLYSNGKTIRLGNLKSTRDFNFVLDTVSAFIELAGAKGGHGEVFNIGSGREVSIKDLVDTILKITKKKVEIVHDQKRLRPEKSEVDRLLCDASKIKKFCGWQSKISLQEGLERTAPWIEQNLDKYKFNIYNI